MALVEIFPLTLISSRVGPAVRKWPAGTDVVKFVLNDASFTNPAQLVTLLMQLSWDNKATWTPGTSVTWKGGDKAKDGSSPFVTLGPHVENGSVVNPTHIRFYAEPKSGPVTIGLFADADPDV